MTITLLGLGPGHPDLLTRSAWQVLQNAPEIHLRTRQHPAVAAFPARLAVHSFDHLYESGETFESVYEQIIDRVLELAARSEGVVYGVPGHPLIAEATGPEILRRAREAAIPVRVVAGLSFIEPVFEALEIDPFPQTALVDAFDLARGHAPSARFDRPVLVAQVHSRRMASEVKLTLMALYPDEHPVRLVHGAGTDRLLVEDLALWEIDRSDQIGLLTSLYLPPLPENTSFESFLEIVSRLRAPDGCPWDREQTHLSLRPFLLDEVYEALDALDRDAPEELAEELGDLLFQIVFHAVIAAEAGDFTMADVLKGIGDKLVRRHPHVFDGLAVDGVDEIIRNWDRLKAEEKLAKKGSAERAPGSILDGVPRGLPALAQASSLQRRASRTGFEWPDIGGVFDKLEEELDELRNAPEAERASELGDVLFVLAHLANWYGFSAEDALRETNLRFRERFGYVEEAVRAAGRSLGEMTLDDMNVLWEEAKRGRSGKSGS
ncbi:MAG TPA: nucleoside triphosphate pyrophosphohydrolase [Anaerolineales bacterium]|nr:nucleoside triphosphate pyrophosphohydrolase [Anaerolineales bacterium]